MTSILSQLKNYCGCKVGTRLDNDCQILGVIQTVASIIKIAIIGFVSVEELGNHYAQRSIPVNTPEGVTQESHNSSCNGLDCKHQNVSGLSETLLSSSVKNSLYAGITHAVLSICLYIVFVGLGILLIAAGAKRSTHFYKIWIFLDMLAVMLLLALIASAISYHVIARPELLYFACIGELVLQIFFCLLVHSTYRLIRAETRPARKLIKQMILNKKPILNF